MSISQQITALRKGGDLGGAEKLAHDELKKNHSDRYLQNAYGWVIYFRLKEISDGLLDNKMTHMKAVSGLNHYVDEYFQLNLLSKPDLLHSLVLTQVLKIDKEWIRFVGFAKWWGVDNFREEDHEMLRLNNGKEIASLVLRYFYRIGHALTKHHADLSDTDQAWGENQLNEALNKHPDDQWLNYYKSKLLLLKGDSKGAQQALMLVIRRQKRAYWAWAHLGDILSIDNLEQSIICYQYAVSLAQKPGQIVNVREKLAKLLAIKERFEEAAAHLKRALTVREKEKLKIPDSLKQLLATNWYQQNADLKLSKELDVSSLVDDILYESANLVSRFGVLDNQNEHKKLAYISFGVNEGVVLRYKQFTGIENIKLGSVVSVEVEEGGSTAIRWSESEKSTIDGLLENFVGLMEKPDDREFGFLRVTGGPSIFVPPNLMKKIGNVSDENFRCKAILSMDKKKGKEGWVALKVEKI
ncbi:MAG: hypothetical protein HOA38_04070 [Candidatus Marinimicrobia bacterium]|jgi:tetratricopeptide (TPR) repeat protein|nr:hypothetical protein [Candidatus Neomarinimicrobiota bacterium]